jgi:pimeloyl-ACP methyl ester carboxylesterase
LRRLGVAGLVLLLLLAGVSAGYNALTARRASVPDGLSYVRAADVSTRYRTWGRSGSPVVLVHGAAGSADTWEAVGQRLGERHRVYALDLVGWGYSYRVAPFDLDHQVRQLLAFVAVLGLGRPLLVGHSSGAAVVAEAALRQPYAVGGLMLLDGDASAVEAGKRSLARFLLVPPFRTTLLRLAVGSDTLIRTAYERACGSRCPSLDAAGMDRWRRPFRVPGAESGVWGMVAEGVPGLPVARLQELRWVPFPKAVVFGAEDSVFDSGTAQRTADTIGAPRPVTIPQARHLPMISDPAIVTRTVEDLYAVAASSG